MKKPNIKRISYILLGSLAVLGGAAHLGNATGWYSVMPVINVVGPAGLGIVGVAAIIAGGWMAWKCH